MRRNFLLAWLPIPLLAALSGCSHSPDTVVHLSAPTGGSWVVRDHTGLRMCSLPCRVGLDEHDTVVVARENGGQEFVLHQEAMGKGSWSGTVRVREVQTSGAIAVAAFSGALVAAGTNMVASRRDDRMTAGIVLTGLGAVGALIADAMPGTRREELWLERMNTSSD
jgi:hypothetical protein